MTLTFNPGRDIVMTLTLEKLKIKGQSVQKTEWKQTEGRTDGQTYGQTDTTDCFTFPANSIGKHKQELLVRVS